MKAHALKVMQTVDVAVKGLADLDKLVPVLQGLGKKHVPYGVLPEHYEVVGQALLATLAGGLGAEWTDKVAPTARLQRVRRGREPAGMV